MLSNSWRQSQWKMCASLHLSDICLAHTFTPNIHTCHEEYSSPLTCILCSSSAYTLSIIALAACYYKRVIFSVFSKCPLSEIYYMFLEKLKEWMRALLPTSGNHNINDATSPLGKDAGLHREFAMVVKPVRWKYDCCWLRWRWWFWWWVLGVFAGMQYCNLRGWVVIAFSRHWHSLSGCVDYHSI